MTVFHDPLIQYLEKPPQNNINPVGNQFRMNFRTSNYSFQKQLEQIDQTFLVGIHEYYTYSIVLLKRRLGFQLKDIVFIPLRKQLYHEHMAFDKKQNNNINRKLCEINKFDCHIYDHLNKSFWRNVVHEGISFQNEVTYFESILVKVSGFCKSLFSTRKWYEGSFKLNKLLHISKSIWNDKFCIKALDCCLMRLDEPALSTFFFYLQNPTVCKGWLRTKNKRKCQLQLFHSVLCDHVGNKEKMLLGLLSIKEAYI